MIVIEAKVDHVENSICVHRFEHLHRILLPGDVIFCGDFFEKSKKSAFKKFELTSPVELRLPDSELVRISASPGPPSCMETWARNSRNRL